MSAVERVAVSGAQSLSDEEVVRRVRAGEPALFEIVMRRHNQRIYRVARAILRDDAEAEDVMQYAYVQAFARLEQFDGRGGFAAWLARIAVNEALARVRLRARHAPFDGEVAHARALDPERAALAQELGRILEAAIDALPDAQRVVFVLRDVEGLSTSEAAAALGIRDIAVRVRLHRARSMLRRELRASDAASAFRFDAPRCDRVVAAVLTRIGAAAA